MRPSECEAIRPHLQEAFDRIDFDLRRSSSLHELFTEWTAELPEGTPAEVKPKPLSRKHPPIPGPSIEAAYPWRHVAARAAKDLRECGWTKEAAAIAEVLTGLPTGPADGNQPEILKAQFDAIRAGAERIRTILTTCLAGGPSPQGGKGGAAGNDDKGDDPDSPLSPAKLADRLGIPQNAKKEREALRKRLESWRKANLDGGWIETRDPKPREPRYLYPLGKVWSLIQDLKPCG